MRQAGVIAAAGVVALEHMIDRLAEDHANAHVLATGLAELPGVDIAPEEIRTNLVYFSLSREAMPPEQFRQELGKVGIKMSPVRDHRFRAVTHYGIEKEDVLRVLSEAGRLLGG